jgi:hypothetical protein
MARQLANFAESALSVSILSGDTSAVLVDGSVFPAVGDFMVRVEDEYIRVTNRSTNTLTLVRAQEGSTAVAHTAGSLFRLVVSVETFEEYFGDNTIFGTAASRPGTGKVGQIYQATDIDASWRYQANGWELVHPCFVPYNGAIDLSTWTSFNLGTTNWTVTAGLLAIDAPQGSTLNLRGYYHNKPSAPFTATMAIRIPAHWPNTDWIGIALSDTTKFWVFRLGTPSGIQLQTQDFNNITTAGGSALSSAIPADMFIYIRFRDDNSNWYNEFSYDNKNWFLHQQTARNFTLTPTKIGIVRNRQETVFPDGAFQNVLGYWES